MTDSNSGMTDSNSGETAPILCAVYKTNKTDEMYLFVDQREGMSRVPEELMARFANPELVTKFKLTPEKKLARADAKLVFRSIQDAGYYLQMPPPKDAHLAPLANRNELLPRQ